MRKTKAQTICITTVQLINVFVFATQIVRSIYFLNPKFKAFDDLLWNHRPVCVGPGRNLEDRFLRDAAHIEINRRCVPVGVS